ncbi:hypothetical protein LCGC14_2288990 [marine sediment metagenome]|uniref:Uncharacterized protein n=1 Tax=marine sediment metagenome TaxID=412755 RepID=A0A0F9CSA4_9ZZZZ
MDKKLSKLQIFGIVAGSICLIVGLISIIPESKPKSKPVKIIRKRASDRHLSGIYRLPADGSIVERDVEKKIIKYRKRERLYLKQLGSTGKYLFINDDDIIDDIVINNPTYNTARAIGEGIVRLKSLDGKEHMVKVLVGKN